MIGLRLGLSVMVPASARPVPTTSPVNRVAPSITGVQTQGQTVTANPGQWDGMPSANYAYQWKRAGTNIGGATASTYLLTGTDVGQSITVQVVATNIIGSSSPATSALITPTATLTISGTPTAPTVGSAYTFTPTSTGGHTPKAFALTGTLPSGLSFNTSTGAITGTPLSTGTASGLNITVTDADGLTAALGTFSLVVSAPGIGPGIVTGIEVLGDIVIPITNPAALNIDMPINGIAMKVTTSGSAAHTALDLASKPPVAFCRTRGHDVNGNQVWQLHTVVLGTKLIGPYNEKTPYQPVAGQFYLVGSHYIYNQDATWKTEVLSVYFPAGWLLSQPEGSVDTGIVRSDSRAFPPFPMRDLSMAFGDAIPSGGTFHFETEVGNIHARAKSQVACVKAWLVDKNSLAGPVSTISAMTLSSNTPGGEPGRPAPVYKADLATTGLAQGRCYTRHTAYPWMGPPQDSATYGGDMANSCSPAKGMPVYLDLDGSHVRLYGIINQNPASATIANNTNVTTANVSGLSTTIAGALASGITYATEGTVLAAVQRVNNSATALTIAHPVTGAAFSYQRATTHADISGASVVYPAVVGSVAGADTGAYVLRNQTGAMTSGEVMAELRSVSGTFSDTVRLRGVDPYTGSQVFAFNFRQPPSRCILRGLYFDSVGATTDNNSPVISNWSSSDATIYTEANMGMLVLIDCKSRARAAGNPFWPVIMPSHWRMEIRYDCEQGMVNFGEGNYYTGGLYAGIGCKYKQTYGLDQQRQAVCLVGVYLVNVGLEGQGAGANRKSQVGRIFCNVDQEQENHYQNGVSGATITRINTVGDVRGGEAWINVLYRCLSSTVANYTSWLISGDAQTNGIDMLVMHQCGAFTPNVTDSQTGRINFAYNDAGYIGIIKLTVLRGCYWPGYNIKGDGFVTAVSPNSLGAATHSTANTYRYGDVVKNVAGTLAYQAKQDVPVSTAITDTTYWYAGDTPATAYGAQPRRQGNYAPRSQVGFSGIVTTGGADSLSTPSATAWIGYTAAANSKMNSNRALWFASGFTPSISGDLYARVPAGEAPVPFDLLGNVFANNGFDCAGPIAIAA